MSDATVQAAPTTPKPAPAKPASPPPAPPPGPPKPKEPWEVFSSHNGTVTTGASVTYAIRRSWAVIPDNAFVRWYWHDDNANRDPDGNIPLRNGPAGTRMWKDKEWPTEGRYTVVAFVSEMVAGKKKEQFYFFRQHVENVEVALFRDMKRATDEGLNHPVAAYNMVNRYARTLRDIERVKGVPANKKDEHEKTLANYEQYAKKLESLLAEAQCSIGTPLPAVHIEHASQRRSKLNLYLFMDTGASEPTWKIVDWTNPLQRERTGVYTGTGATDEEAIRAAIHDFDSGNRYYDGTVMVQVPSKVCGKIINRQVETDGKSTWDSVASFFEWIAMGAAVVAGVVTLVAPVPGSQLVSAAIWTSIFSSTAAAVINIGQRHNEGFGNLKDDAFDGLTIVGNLFAGAGMWAKGGTVLAKNAQGAVVKYTLVGQVATDGVSGVLIAAESMGQYDAIMNDGSLSPQERADKLLELFRSLAIAGTMTYVSVKGTREDLSNLNKPPAHPRAGDDPRSPQQKLNDLARPGGKELDTTKPPPAEGHTDKRESRTRIQEEHQRKHPDGPPGLARRKRKWTFKAPTKSPRQRGMRDRDNATFMAKAQEKKVYIFVRDGNEDAVDFIGKEGHTAKGETMKAKTNKDMGPPPPKGLVAFDPRSQRTLESLAGEPPPMSPAALKADRAEFQRRYDAFLHDKIEHYGYKVLKEENYLVVDAQGRKIHGDVDLHGVYGRDGKLQDSTAIRAELNKEMGTDLIQHGAHDEWSLRNTEDAGVNRGPQPPVTVYTPDGQAYHLTSREEMKAFFVEHKLDWESAYGDFERSVQKIDID